RGRCRSGPLAPRSGERVRERGNLVAAGGAGRRRRFGDRALAAPVVHALAQLLANLEECQALGPDVDRLARARVAALVLLVGADRKASEAADLDPFALAKRVDHRVEHLADEK